jgi:hypothetical protein
LNGSKPREAVIAIADCIGLPVITNTFYKSKKASNKLTSPGIFDKPAKKVKTALHLLLSVRFNARPLVFFSVLH